MGFYERLRDSKAGPMFQKYGMSVTLRRTTQGAYNPSTGAMSAGTSADYTCLVVITEYNQFVVDGTLIKRGDKRLLVAAKGLDVVPSVSDVFLLSDGQWKVPDSGGAVKTLAPAGIAIMYEVQVRR